MTEREQVVQYLTRTAKRHSKHESTARTSESKAISGAIADALEVAADTIKRGEHIALNERFGNVDELEGENHEE